MLTPFIKKLCKMKKKEKIFEAWESLIRALKEIENNNDDAAKLYHALLKRLPNVVLVEFSHRTRNAYIQGVSDLFTLKNHCFLSDDEIKNQRLAFSFFLNDKAVINQGWYSGEEIFSGTWFETVDYLIKKIYQSTVRQPFSQKKEKAFAEFIKQMS